MDKAKAKKLRMAYKKWCEIQDRVWEVNHNLREDLMTAKVVNRFTRWVLDEVRPTNPRDAD